jgi:hypothetical protein
MSGFHNLWEVGLNIFAVDLNPEFAAQMLCDRHNSKMILESAQMLTAVAKRYKHPTLYRVSHENHPCTRWAGDSRENWNWLIRHGLALEAEKIHRTGIGHASADVIRWYRDHNYGPPEDDKGLTEFALAMPDAYKIGDTVASYRLYYLNDKQYFKDGKRPKWTNREPPDWWEFR